MPVVYANLKVGLLPMSSCIYPAHVLRNWVFKVPACTTVCVPKKIFQFTFNSRGENNSSCAFATFALLNPYKGTLISCQ